jgi:hypothetical protein
MATEQPITRRTKAVIAAAVAGTGALVVAAVDNAVTLGEAVGVLGAAVAAAGAVYGVNRAGEVSEDDQQGDHEAP